jgi:subtilisin family serine protease
MQRTTTRALVAFAFISGVLAATTCGAARPVLPTDGAKMITPAHMPLGVGQPVTVVVQLSGDPVAVQQGNAGRKLSKSEKDQIKSQLKGAQDSLRASIESLGGTVLANYQASYNGVKVRIARDKVDQLRSLPGVIGVRPVQLFKPSNIHGIPLIGAPNVWQNPGLHGEGIKIAIIDTGIDYTHANFGGPGTAAAYTAAHAHETEPANPALFGPAAPRVKGGTDLVGDSYNADPNDPAFQPIPHPDPNPLDCEGHGSHVAGTAAGSGVLSTGVQYTGTYNAATVSGNSWTIGPGVAPKADLYAVRVFGCTGPTDVVVDAIEWAVDHDMDVINMSLGSPFGTNDTPDAVAATNAAKAGIIVVTSAGNENPNAYTVGSPSTADGAISVAANDPNQTFAGATILLPGGVTATAINANGFVFPPAGTNYTVKVITNTPGTAEDESLGCSVAAFGGPLPANTLAVVNRGNCARVAKAIFGQQAGAAAVLMVNNAAGLPPFEGPITSNPDDGVPFNVTIPFLGVTQSDGPKFAAANGMPAHVTPTLIANPLFTGFASFTSGGPRSGDSFLKPEITAPGVSISSTAVGTGNGQEILSGTSMAAPHVTGVAALTRQARPTWTVADIKGAIVNTGDPSLVVDYRTSIGGTGFVQPQKSTASRVVAHTDDGDFAVSLNYGFAELLNDFSKKKTIKLRNNGSVAAKFNVAEAFSAGRPHSVIINPTQVTVPANNTAEVKVTLTVPVATAGDENDGSILSFQEVSGLIVLTPATASDNAGVTLRVPYYFVPRALSGVETKIDKLSGNNPSTHATVTNSKGVIAGNADFYALGLQDSKESGKASNDVRAIGAQSFPLSATQAILVFAVNTYDRWSNASQNEFDIYVDVDGDGVDDYIVVGADQGAIQLGDNNGLMGSFVFSTRSPGASIVSFANAPTDGSTAELIVLASQLCRPGTPGHPEPCLSAAHPRITYHAVSFDLTNGGVDVVSGSAKFNVWSNAVSTGAFVNVAPGQTDSSTIISVNSAEFALTPAAGLMVVTLDNPAGEGEAQLIDLKLKK